MFEKFLLILLCLQYGSTISFCYQNETPQCSRESTDSNCFHENFKRCLMDRYIGQGFSGQPGCVNSCENMLGQNANITIECLAEYQAEKMAHKLKESACVTLESQQLGMMQQTTFPPINMTEVMKYKMDKNFAENYVPIKMYKKCVKTCQKNAGGGMSKKGKKHAKQPKNMDFQLCYEQAFKKPYFHVKGSRTASAEYCSMKLKSEKYAAAAKLSDCMKNALGNVSPQNVQEEEESSQEEED